MVSRLNVVNLAIFVVPVVVIAFAVSFMVIRAEAKSVVEVGTAAHANLVSSSGESIGTVSLVQGISGVLVQVQAEKLAPGGHAFIIHEVGMCTPDFAAAGGHFDPNESEDGFIHPSWKDSDSLGAHGGDLPNIYAAGDGTVRADFFTDGISLDSDSARSIFDANGSSIIIYEKPDAYAGDESDAGERIACGVIYRN